MNARKWTTQTTGMVMLLALLTGLLLILAAKFLLHGTFATLAESFGVAVATIVTAAFLYEKLLAEKHFDLFKAEMAPLLKQVSDLVSCQMGQIQDLLKGMNNVQAACTRLGIREVFDSRSEYERKYDMTDMFERVKPNGRILVVARTLFHFFNKREALKKALQRGANLQIACVGSRDFDPTLAKVCVLKPSEIQSPLECLSDLVTWIGEQKKKPDGSLEVRTYKEPLPDSLLYIELMDSELVVWDLTFERDLRDKKVFLLEPCEMNLGRRLLKRYETIWDSSGGSTYLKITAGGNIVTNRLAELMAGFAPIGMPNQASEVTARKLAEPQR